MAEKDDVIEIRDHRQPGWFWAQNEVVDDYGPRIGPYGLAVYGVLARFVSNRTQRARVGVRKIAKILGTGKEQVLNALRLLEDEGLINSFVERGRTAEYALLDLKGSVPGAGTVKEGCTRSGYSVSSERVHGVPGADTSQDSSSRLSSKGEVEDIWNQTLESLKLQMLQATFDQWLKNSRGVSLDDHVLTVQVQTQGAVEWCTDRMGKVITRTLREVMGDEVEVKFVVK